MGRILCRWHVPTDRAGPPGGPIPLPETDRPGQVLSGAPALGDVLCMHLSHPLGPRHRQAPGHEPRGLRFPPALPPGRPAPDPVPKAASGRSHGRPTRATPCHGNQAAFAKRMLPFRDGSNSTGCLNSECELELRQGVYGADTNVPEGVPWAGTQNPLVVPRHLGLTSCLCLLRATARRVSADHTSVTTGGVYSV